jgi:hypothetical protein
MENEQAKIINFDYQFNNRFRRIYCGYFFMVSISDNVSTSPVTLSVSPGTFEEYEIKYYTVNNVFKYDKNIDAILVYNENTLSWNLPTYDELFGINYTFDGIFINQYDPLIPLNNLNNNLIIELYVNYKTDIDLTILQSVITHPSLADEAINEIGYQTSRPYFLSEVVYLQMMIDNKYQNILEGENIYNNLVADFNSLDGSNQLVYPLMPFYDESENSLSSIDFGQTVLQGNNVENELYFYFNISYYENKILEFLNSEQLEVSISNLNFIVFFQDLKIILRENEIL